MIRFACPSCQKVYTAPEDSAGRSMDCKKCGSRVVIPQTMPQKPVHGIPLPPTDTGRPRETQWPDPPPLPTAKVEDDGIPIRSESAVRSLSRKANYALLIFLSVVVPLALLFTVIIFMVQRGKQHATAHTGTSAPTAANLPPAVNANEGKKPEVIRPGDRDLARPAGNPPNKLDQLRIEGEWTRTVQLGSGEVVIIRYIFNNDGSFRQLGKMKKGGVEIPVSCSGVWELENGYLHRTINESTSEVLFATGLVIVDHVDSVDRNEMVLTSSLGGTKSYHRAGK